MLRELAVRDLALIDRVRLTFEPGLTVITGETGAGKSLLIDALGLVMGARSDTSLVRHGAAGARVEALFDVDATPEPLICVREVSSEGRSIARIDDETVTAARLSQVVGPLLEIHGQHEQQRLLSAAWQRDVLDAIGGLEPLRQTVATMVRELRANEAALRELSVEPAELERRLELAGHAADEIDAAAPREGEVDELRTRLALAGNAQRIVALLAETHDLIAADGPSAREGIAQAVRSAGELARLDPDALGLADRIAGVEAELDDIALELRRRQENVAEAASDSAVLEARLGVLFGLMRKYGETEDALIAYGDAARSEVERLRSLDEQRELRTLEGQRLFDAARTTAAELSTARRDTAIALSRAVTTALVELGFPSAAFDVDIANSALDESGVDVVTFLLAPNPGEPPRSLARIASGGEMSRVALALKTVLATADETPTLIFDEVDAGIGGRSAEPVGRMLWRLARDHQVVCVTHLPQIAAYADNHVRISKVERDGRTVTNIEPLEADGRRRELAQMMGGTAGADAALSAADALLEGAARVRQEVGTVA